MDRVTIDVSGKINLALDICEKRADGYHELRSVMQSVGLSDRITIEKTEEPAVKVSCTDPAVPCDERNLAHRAASILREACGLREGVRISIEKAIPVAGGMAGGSADGAGVLAGMNALFSLGFSEDELRSFASLLGSDVPFLVSGGTALALGRGEIIRILPDAPKYAVLLGNPGTHLSTPEVFRAIDEGNADGHPDVEALVSAIFAGGRTKREAAENVAGKLGNNMERAAVKLEPKIGSIRGALKENGARSVLLSGSGPTVFGLFFTKKERNEAAKTLRKTCPDFQWIETETVTRGIRIR